MIKKHDSEIIKDLQQSIAASSSVFPGVRFSPTDIELVSYYLRKKLEGSDNCVDIIPEIDLYSHEPWDLPGLSIIPSDNEWFFFSMRGRKYPHGSQSKRATEFGYWKATGKERDVKLGSVTIGTKRALVFHTGRAPKGERTEWIMHEYCTCDQTLQDTQVVCRLRRNNDFRLNESSRGSDDHHEAAITNDGPVDAPIVWFDEGNDAMNNFYSMESKRKDRSHSDEQQDSESVTDQQLIHDLADGSSTPYKEKGNDDDCFTDIMNDDIVNLDESTSHSRITQSVTSPQETMIADQGTAPRRSRMKVKTANEKPSSYGGGTTTDYNQASEPAYTFSVLAGTAHTLSMFRPAYRALIFLFLIILFVAWQAR